jgi:hypothetical protein
MLPAVPLIETVAKRHLAGDIDAHRITFPVLDQRLLAGACADVRVTDIEMTAPKAAAATAIVIIESRKLSRAISPFALP